jgi:hypothetical protein
MSDVGAVSLNCGNEGRQMRRIPHVVVTKISDVPAPCQRDSGVVRPALTAHIFRQVVPAEAWVVERSHYIGRIIGAGIPDNEILEIGECLP